MTLHTLGVIGIWWMNASLIFAIVKATLRFPRFEENR